MLQIVITNLISNAWKYTSKTDHASIEVGNLYQDGETVFYVKDNGAGFDMAHQTKLFTPFKRLHSDKDFMGTGIGLSTVKRIINKHGGQIWAKSQPERGATFYFTLSEPSLLVDKTC